MLIDALKELVNLSVAALILEDFFLSLLLADMCLYSICVAYKRKRVRRIKDGREKRSFVWSVD